MADKVIPIQKEAEVHEGEHDAVSLMRLAVPITGEIRIKDGRLLDARMRPLRDLRISITDHCNFRCRYCMPKEKFDGRHQFLAHTELLTFEELLRLVRIFIDLGIEKVRLTGGEPLLRKHVEGLIAELKKEAFFEMAFCSMFSKGFASVERLARLVETKEPLPRAVWM